MALTPVLRQKILFDKHRLDGTLEKSYLRVQRDKDRLAGTIKAALALGADEEEVADLLHDYGPELLEEFFGTEETDGE